MCNQANNKIMRITSAISVSSNENGHDLNNPRPFSNPPDSRDIFLLPNAGMYYTVKELRDAKSTLWKKSLEEIAQYADYITRGSCNEPWMVDKSEILSTIHIEKFAGGCTINFGNTAYLALYCNDLSVKHAALIIMTKWKKYEQKNHRRSNDFFYVVIIATAAFGILCLLIS